MTPSATATGGARSRKSAARKSAPRKSGGASSARKSAARKSAAPHKSSGRKSRTARAQTRSQVVANIAAKTGCSKADVKAVLEAHDAELIAGVKRDGVFKIGKLVRVKKTHRPAKPAADKLVFGKMTHVAAKPASTSVRASALKALKDEV